MASAYEDARFRAYLSEPITRCPQREKGRIKTLVQRISDFLSGEPYNTSVYIPSLVTSPERRGAMTPEHVYLLDRVRIVEADFLLVVADQTSFGIGGEVELATSLGEPVVFFSRAETLSRFLIGSPVNFTRHEVVPAIHYIRYRDWRSLKPQLAPVIETIVQRLDASEANQIPHWDIATRLRGLREQRGISRPELAQRAGLMTAQIELWELTTDALRDSFASYQPEDAGGIGEIALSFRQMEQLANPGLDAIHRLCFALDVSVTELLGETSNQLPTQGPGKLVGVLLRQIREARVESLMNRAHQFDITFREFDLLREQLVDAVLDDSMSQTQIQSRYPNHITETEFLDALMSIRASLV